MYAAGATNSPPEVQDRSAGWAKLMGNTQQTSEGTQDSVFEALEALASPGVDVLDALHEFQQLQQAEGDKALR